MRFALRQIGLRWFVLLAALIVFAETAAATTVIIPADDDLMIGARAIVRGRVLAVMCDFDQQGRIYTYITLRVNGDRLFGEDVFVGVDGRPKVNRPKMGRGTEYPRRVRP